MDPKDSDRAQILRRRAFFVSSALTALGCNSSGRPPEGQPSSATEPTAPPTVRVPTPAGPTATTSATAPPAPEEEPLGAAPDLSTPPGVSEITAQNYKSLREAVAEIRKQIDELGGSLPDACRITDQACDLQWRKLAEGLLDIDKSIRRLPPRCGGSSDEAKAYFVKRDAARDDLQARVAALGKRIRALVATQAEQERWEAHQVAAKQANPEPCLKFACTDW
ncbi:MAG: hypothetical protein KC766_14140 [Myxococcales bacterium]|nr:hypothetical protein [Myxococcales bacterium]